MNDGKEHIAEVHEPRLGGDFLVSTSPLRDEKGNLIGSVHVARNITELKKTEEALAQSNLKITEILESIQDNFYSLNRDWNFVYVNKQAANLLGKKPEELIGHNIWKMFPNSVGTIFEKNYREVMEKGRFAGSNHAELMPMFGLW